MTDLENQTGEDHFFILGDDNGTTTKNISRVVHDEDYIQFGNEKYLKSDLAAAFGGTLNPGLVSPPKHNLANPAPLGLSAFALTTFIFSLINAEAGGVKIPAVVIGLAFFYGGAAQFVAGMFELAVADTFGGVALSSYAAFWCAWGATQVDSFGIVSAYGTNKTEFRYAVGIFLVGWFILTFLFCAMTLKSTVDFFLLFFCLSITFLLLAISEFQNSVPVKKAGGIFGIITSFIAWYNAYAGIANSQNTYLTVKAIPLPDLQDKRD
ncbi:hypothetical protein METBISCDRAFT_27946 [Metschnikowia bicuspidata]|uniref:Uncharacterized protein n=1 Tax=Metschnikowia bicuspidata TaxID=27322 RepID=A0A4P9ZAH1_9ASCO|nr:hypothetical protein METBISCDRAFT_27946 [Metschnikowia bicuspidata]